MLITKDVIKCECVYSDDNKHRLYFKKVWDKTKPCAAIITIHPASADNILLDQTTHLATNGIARLEKYGGIIVVNLFSLLTSKLETRWARDIDINDPDNDNYIKKAVDEASIVIFAWGRTTNSRIQNRASQLAELLKEHKDKIFVICDGDKRLIHPLSPSIRNIPWVLEPFYIDKEESNTVPDDVNESAPT